MWLWIGRLLAGLATFKKLFLWLGLAIPFISQIVGWVGRLWNASRNTLLGRLLRMAGVFSVAGALSLYLARLIFQQVGGFFTDVFSGGFAWPTNPFMHSIMGAVNLVIPLPDLLQMLILWLYLSLFTLALRFGKYIVSLTVG